MVTIRHFYFGLTFTGKELDDSTGLYYYGARYYDPVLGRFITPDSIVQAPYDPQSLNRYAYCRNNPLKYVDPTGNEYWPTGDQSSHSEWVQSQGLAGSDYSGSGNSTVFQDCTVPEGTVTIGLITSVDGESSFNVDTDGTVKNKASGKESESEKVKRFSNAELLHAVIDAGKRKDAKQMRILQNECIRRNNLTSKKILQKAMEIGIDLIAEKTIKVPVTPAFKYVNIDVKNATGKTIFQHTKECGIETISEGKNNLYNSVYSIEEGTKARAIYQYLRVHE